MALIKSTSSITKEPSGSQPIESSSVRVDVAALVSQLNGENAESRRWAARDLVDCPGSSAALMQRLSIEQDDSVREVILTTLVHLGGSAHRSARRRLAVGQRGRELGPGRGRRHGGAHRPGRHFAAQAK